MFYILEMMIYVHPSIDTRYLLSLPEAELREYGEAEAR